MCGMLSGGKLLVETILRQTRTPSSVHSQRNGKKLPQQLLDNVVQKYAHSKMSSVRKKKTRQYSEEYLKFGFIPAVQDKRIPLCLLCQQFLSNESMKRGRLEAHLKVRILIQI
ncbi:hypothetical protein TNCV_144501 [Trichonephila clavipes]|nr:hypothetical protein TNCV_144501 [Trichonephila clavipes]